MAIQIINNGTNINRITNIVPASSNYTCIFWYKLVNLVGVFNVFVTANGTPGDNSYTKYVEIYGNFPNLGCVASDGSSAPEIDFTNLVVGQWIPVAYVRSGNVHDYYVAGVFIGSSTLNISVDGFNFTLLGDDGGNSGDTQQFYNFREWNVALSLAQINAEIASFSSVVHTSNLVTYTPLTSDLLDVSGNGNNWTQVGSPTFVANPTLPSNFTPTNAISISSLPYSNTQNVFDGTTAYTVWYSYTTISGDNVLGPFAFGAIGGYAPICNVLESDLSDYITGFSNNANAALLMPSEGVSTTYYFEIVPNAPQVSSATLTFSLVRHVDVTAPIGTVAISSDIDTDNNYDLPLALLNPNADGVLAFVNPFTVGEQANILVSGVLAVSDDDEGSGTAENIIIYDTSYAKTSTTALGAICLNITSDAGQTTFYFLIKSGSNYVVKSINTSGTIGGTTYNLGTSHVKNIAVDPTNTYIYYQILGNNTIKTWVIATNMAGSDIVSGSAATLIQDLLCLTDGSIVTADSISTRRYNSSGVLQNTYTVPGTVTATARMCAGTTAAYFVMYLTYQNNTVPLPVIQIRCSDGVILNNQSYSTFESAYNQMAVSATPVRFGPSQSCPIWVARTALTFTNSTIVVGKASNPLATGVTFMVNGPAGMFSIMTDTSPGQIINVAPGTYSIVEQPQAMYNPTYFVSNDPVNNNNTAIVVGTSELVDVVVLNTLSQPFGGLYTLVPGKTNDTLRNQDNSTVNKMINWFYELFTDRDK